MKTRRYLFTGLLIGLLLGWLLSYFRLPETELQSEFLLGFITCLVFISLLFVIWISVRENSIHSKRNEKSSAANSIRSLGSSLFFRPVLLFIVIAVCVASVFLFYHQNRVMKAGLVIRDNTIKQQSEQIKSGISGNLILRMNKLLGDMDAEMKISDTLSAELISGIAALSMALKPYRILEGDSLSENEISPERAQLLKALLLAKPDSISFARIKAQCTFAYAELNGEGLSNTDLSYADLHGANLKNANLQGSNLSGAQLHDAQLWGANLNHTNLKSTDLRRADLRWSQLNRANLQLANLNGAQLSNAQFRVANLQGATMQWADLNGALVMESNLTGVNLMGTELTKVNFRNARLTRTDLRMTKLYDANFSGTDIHLALVDSNWTDKLSQWRLTGFTEMRDGYKIVTDTLDQWKKPIHRLERLEK